jgi:glycosyltransferase involved in cell wall biosynthesis
MTPAIQQAKSNAPIKIMHVIARLNIGGAALYVIQLTEQLGSPEFQSQLVCGVVGESEGDMQYAAQQRNIPVTLIPSLGREISPIGDLRTIYRLWRLMRRERPQVVNTHTAKAGFVGRVAAKLAGVPVIVHTFHGHVFAGYFGPTKTKVFITLERICARFTTSIITLTSALKRELTEVYHITRPEHVEVIELGFELEPLAALQCNQGGFREQHNIPPDAPLLGIVGRLVPIKNHDLFLHAAKLVRERVPNAHFAIVGDGERREELAALVRSLGLEDCVHFTGWCADTLPVYSALDVLVLSSRNEGLPVSLIEAMAAGVPVVSTAVGGVNDLLDNGRLGAVVPTNDPGEMADRIVAALTDPAVKARTGEAKAAVIERYDIRRNAARMSELYRQLVAR